MLNHLRDIAIGSGRGNYKRWTLTNSNDKLCTHRVGKTMFKALEGDQKPGDNEGDLTFVGKGPLNINGIFILS